MAIQLYGPRLHRIIDSPFRRKIDGPIRRHINKAPPRCQMGSPPIDRQQRKRSVHRTSPSDNDGIGAVGWCPPKMVAGRACVNTWLVTPKRVDRAGPSPECNAPEGSAPEGSAPEDS